MLKNIYSSNYIMNINYMLTRGGGEKTLKNKGLQRFWNNKYR